MTSSEDHTSAQDVLEYVRRHAPELDSRDVEAFMAEHPRPADETDSHLAWAVRVLRDRGEGEHGAGLPVDRVMDEMRRLDR